MATITKDFLLGKDLLFTPDCVGYRIEDFEAGAYILYDVGLLSVLVTGSTLLSGEYILTDNNGYTFDLVRSDSEYTFHSYYNENYEWQNWELIQGASNKIGTCTEAISAFDSYSYPYFTPNGWALNDGTFLTLNFYLSVQSQDNNWVPAVTSIALNRNWLIDTFYAYNYSWCPEAFKNKRYELAEKLDATIDGRPSNKISFLSNLYNLVQGGINSSFNSVTAVTGKYFSIENTGNMELDTITNTCSSLTMDTKFYVY